MAVAAQRSAVDVGGHFIDVIFDVTDKTGQPAFGGHIRSAVGGSDILEDGRLDGGIRQIIGLHLHRDIRLVSGSGTVK